MILAGFEIGLSNDWSSPDRCRGISASLVSLGRTTCCSPEPIIPSAICFGRHISDCVRGGAFPAFVDQEDLPKRHSEVHALRLKLPALVYCPQAAIRRLIESGPRSFDFRLEMDEHVYCWGTQYPRTFPVSLTTLHSLSLMWIGTVFCRNLVEMK